MRNSQANKTVHDIIIPTAGIAMAWDAAGLSSKEASRQLYEATMEIIGEKQGGDCVFEPEADTRRCKWCGNLASDRVHRYAEQLAKARAFYGITETEEGK